MITVERLREKLDNNENTIFVEDVTTFEEAEKVASLAYEITGNKYLVTKSKNDNLEYVIIKIPQSIYLPIEKFTKECY